MNAIRSVYGQSNKKKKNRKIAFYDQQLLKIYCLLQYLYTSYLKMNDFNIHIYCK